MALADCVQEGVEVMALRSLRGKAFADAVQEYVDVTLHLVIRAVREDDLPRLEWFGSLAHWRDVNRRTFVDHQAGMRLMFVADLRGFPIGQVVVDVTSHDYAYLYALRVLEPFQGFGIGSELIGVAEDAARSHGFRQIHLAVEKSNVGARRLYERLGFEIFTSRVDVWSYVDHHGETHWVHEDVYGMRKLLH
jgi:ribosomal protein S18 acetylase RimI-like enzyme